MALVPVALDLTHGGVRVQDRFCLGGADALSFEEFSMSYCKESSLPSAFYDLVIGALRGQAADCRETLETCSQATQATPGERLETLRSAPGYAFKLMLSSNLDQRSAVTVALPWQHRLLCWKGSSARPDHLGHLLLRTAA